MWSPDQHSTHVCCDCQSLASTKFRRDGSHFAIVWAIRAGIGRIRLAHTKAFVRAIRVGIGTGRLRDLAIRKWEPVSTKFRRFVGLTVQAGELQREKEDMMDSIRLLEQQLKVRLGAL